MRVPPPPDHEHCSWTCSFECAFGWWQNTLEHIGSERPRTCSWTCSWPFGWQEQCSSLFCHHPNAHSNEHVREQCPCKMARNRPSERNPTYSNLHTLVLACSCSHLKFGEWGGTCSRACSTCLSAGISKVQDPNTKYMFMCQEQVIQTHPRVLYPALNHSFETVWQHCIKGEQFLLLIKSVAGFEHMQPNLARLNQAEQVPSVLPAEPIWPPF